MSKAALPQEGLKIYDSIIASCTGFEREGKTMPFTRANGYMFTLYNKAGEIGVRLPKERQQEFIEKYNSGPYFSYGAKMKDYVLVPENLWKKKKLMKDLFEESFKYVKSLPPK